MTRRLVIRSQAEADITDAAIWYDKRKPGLGNEFVAAVETAIASIIANPYQYRSLRRKPDVRRVLTRRFPYRIFFVLRADVIVVFRVLHGARHDREWEQAIPKN